MFVEYMFVDTIFIHVLILVVKNYREAWRAVIHGVAKSRTQLSD